MRKERRIRKLPILSARKPAVQSRGHLKHIKPVRPYKDSLFKVHIMGMYVSVKNIISALDLCSYSIAKNRMSPSFFCISTIIKDGLKILTTLSSLYNRLSCNKIWLVELFLHV